jgi:septum formation protein
LAGEILGKPGNTAEATQMLQQLRRQSHQVYSGLTVMLLSGQKSHFITRLHQSTVWMRPYSDAEIAAYVASGDSLDKAGAYGIQNKVFAPVERLDGCFASVMGLPLGELAAAFREIGLSLPEVGPLCTGCTGYPCCQDSW